MSDVKVGQRWLWTVDTRSKTIIEVTSVHGDYVDYVYVQVIVKGYPEDMVGRNDTTSSYSFEGRGLGSFTYLEGQDKPQ